MAPPKLERFRDDDDDDEMLLPMDNGFGDRDRVGDTGPMGFMWPLVDDPLVVFMVL